MAAATRRSNGNLDATSVYQGAQEASVSSIAAARRPIGRNAIEDADGSVEGSASGEHASR